MPQTQATKNAWATMGRGQTAMLPLNRLPGMVERLQRAIGSVPHVLLVGNGNGQLVPTLKAPGRTFCALDIASFNSGPVPRVTHDIEKAIERRVVNPGDRPMVIVAPFCFEYTDPQLSGPVIADLLKGGEKFIWISHALESSVVEGITDTIFHRSILKTVINSVLNDPRKWNNAIQKACEALGLENIAELSAEVVDLEIDVLGRQPALDSKGKFIYLMYKMHEALRSGGGQKFLMCKFHV